jgi:competence ComEA-like helix-hairpin-helix protein
MKHKWQYFVVGLLCGILLSGIGFTAYSIGKIQNKTNHLLAESTKVVILPTPADRLTVSTAENIGKIDLNRSTMKELMELPNIGESKARAIIEFREKYGDFEDVNELLYVPGIGEAVFKGLTDLVFVP